MKIILYSAAIVLAYLGYRAYSQPGKTLTNGNPAPDFNLPSANGEMVSLASFKGSWVVLYFYPRDDSPICTKQACNFRDDMQKLEKLGAKVVGISIDSGKSHVEFAKKYNLPFALLSDTNGAVASQYGALTNLGIIKMAKRYTYLIDADGVLQKTYYSVDISKHSQQIIDDLIVLSMPSSASS